MNAHDVFVLKNVSDAINVGVRHLHEQRSVDPVDIKENSELISDCNNLLARINRKVQRYEATLKGPAARTDDNNGKPSWDDAPANATHLAMDKGGYWYWFTGKPIRGDDYWFPNSSEHKYIFGGITKKVKWKKSLEARPVTDEYDAPSIWD